MLNYCTVLSYLKYRAYLKILANVNTICTLSYFKDLEKQSWDFPNRPLSCFWYRTGTSLQWRLVQGIINQKRYIKFAFVRVPALASVASYFQFNTENVKLVCYRVMKHMAPVTMTLANWLYCSQVASYSHTMTSAQKARRQSTSMNRR